MHMIKYMYKYVEKNTEVGYTPSGYLHLLVIMSKCIYTFVFFSFSKLWNLSESRVIWVDAEI